MSKSRAYYNGYISISKKEEDSNKLLYKLPETIDIENLIKDFYENKERKNISWDEETKEYKKKEKLKWYYQTKDLKIHTLKNDKKIEEIISSEKEMELFFEDKICLGCQIRKNFIEIIFDEKKIRVSINNKDTFYNFDGYDNLLEIFNKKCLKIINSKKSNYKKASFVDILSIIGFIIVFLIFVISIVYSRFQDLNLIEDKKIFISIIILGIGFALTFPKNLKNYKKNEHLSSVDLKGLIISLSGFLFIILGFWKLFK